MGVVLGTPIGGPTPGVDSVAFGCRVGSSMQGRAMTSDLRRLQEPLKQRYREDPASALLTLHADAELGAGASCSVHTGRALVEAGLHPATGGNGLAACSGDMLLQALAACAGVTLGAVADSLGMEVSGSVHAEGDLDFRGTLAVDRSAPVGFQSIRLQFRLDGAEDEGKLSTLIRLTERYCVVLQTLRNPPDLSFTLAPPTAS